MKKLQIAGVGLLALTLFGQIVLSAPTALQQQRYKNGAYFVTGGIGLEERHYLEKLKGQYNFRLDVARNDGSYIGDTSARIRTATGRVIVDATLDGPLLLAKLIPGTYHIDVAYNKRVKTRKITIYKTEKQRRLVVHWHTGETEIIKRRPRPVVISPSVNHTNRLPIQKWSRND